MTPEHRRERYTQFGALDRAADLLIQKTRAEASMPLRRSGISGGSLPPSRLKFEEFITKFAHRDPGDEATDFWGVPRPNRSKKQMRTTRRKKRSNKH
jgi:hypothetical protein